MDWYNVITIGCYIALFIFLLHIIAITYRSHSFYKVMREWDKDIEKWCKSEYISLSDVVLIARYKMKILENSVSYINFYVSLKPCIKAWNDFFDTVEEKIELAEKLGHKKEPIEQWTEQLKEKMKKIDILR